MPVDWELPDLPPGARDYPRTWFLLDVLGERARLVGREVVDLSPAAIELREAARQLRGYADNPERWLTTDGRARWGRLGDEHRRSLSFGSEVTYCVERDTASGLHGGRPFRHLTLRRHRGALTPAVSAEIALYFYGRRPAVFGFVAPDRAHGFVGFEWDRLSGEDLRSLLLRELREEEL